MSTTNEVREFLKRWLQAAEVENFPTETKIAIRLIDTPHDVLLWECWTRLIIAKLASAKIEVAEADDHEAQTEKMKRVVGLRNLLAKVSGFCRASKERLSDDR